jgi:hypothetical protein
MPVYPCSKCSHNNDIRESECRKCKNRSPFQCSKCSRALGSFDIYEPDKIKIQKPLYCKRCGSTNEEVFCYHCAQPLIRANAVLREQKGHQPFIYHADCLEKFRSMERIADKAKLVFVPLCAVIGYELLKTQAEGVGGFFGVLCGVAVGLALSRFIRPRK